MTLRIGLNARYLLAEQHTGVEVYLESLIRHLMMLAPNQETVLFLGGAASVPEKLKGLGTTLVSSQWPTGNLFSKVIWEQVGLVREIDNAGLDVFHGPYFTLPVKAKVPTVVTVYDLAYCYFPESFTWRFYVLWKFMLPSVLRKATYVIALSENTKTDLVNLTGIDPERVRVIYAGVDAFFQEEVPPDEMEARLEDLNVRRPYILHVSGYAQRKNVPLFLKALGILKQRQRLEFDFVIAGGGGWAQKVGQEVADLGLEDIVRYTGYVGREDLRALYGGASALVYPSLYEGFGLPPLEAMACGTPVIAASTSSLPEVVGSAGILADPTDAEAWAHAVERIMYDTELRRKLVDFGRQKAGIFSWNRTAEQTLAVYKEAVSG